MTRSGSTRPLLALFADATEQFPDDEAIREAPGRSIGRRELLARATALRNAFVATGMSPGDHVLFAVKAGIDQLALALAICDAGGVVVSCDPHVPNAVFASRLEQLTPRWVVADSLLLAITSRRWPWRVVGRTTARLAPLGAVPDVHRVRVGRWLPGAPPSDALDAFIKRVRNTEVVPDVCDALPALIDFTSGTTAAPKGVVHTRRSLLATVDGIRSTMDAGPGDVVYSGTLHIIFPALLRGARVQIPTRDARGASQLVRQLKQARVTHFFTVPSVCGALVDACVARGEKLPASLRELSIGGAPVHAPLLHRLRDALPNGARVFCVYGMTEMLPVARVSLEEKVAWTEPGDLVGRPVAGVEARIAANGELVLRGPALFDRYLGGEPVAEHATGDLARIVGDRIILLGRAKDMIIRGAFNIYPELYESIIDRIPGVRRCALVGVYDEQRADECVVLVVEPEPGTDAGGLLRRLPDALRAGPFRIDPSAIPDHIVVLSLPESGRSSKVDKVALRTLVKDLVPCA
jgi:acyl-CoA synthetase (AMP-forming)/AMP-acid ligase II